MEFFDPAALARQVIALYDEPAEPAIPPNVSANLFVMPI
jgi:hypothetical protein